MNVAELMVECLEAEGIRHVFAVPGEENADMLFALEASPIEVVLTRHEQGAGFMAATYGRLTGNPAVALATLGPGATNLLTPIADANMDHAPLIAITGQGATSRLHKESHQIIDVERLFEPVTKWTVSVRDAQSAPEIVRKGVRIARAEKPGAVLFELPEDVAAAQAGEATPLQPKRFRRPVAGQDSVADLVDRITNARSPLIMAGNGAIRTRASEALRRIVDLTGIGVVSTFMGKGAIDCAAEACLYSIGLGQKDYVLEAIAAADLVICVGYDLVEYPPERWRQHMNGALVHVDFDPAEIDAYYQPDLELTGDIADSLEAVATGLSSRGATYNFDLSAQANVRRKMSQDISAYAKDDAVDRIKPQKALFDLRAALGPNDVVLSGVGAHKMWVARYYHAHKPNTCLIPNGYCSMGGALPGAIGARLVLQDEKIVAVVGDGDLLMNVQEMETAARLGSDIVVMAWVDDAYGLIAWKQQDEFGRQTSLSFGNPDWGNLASSFDWWHEHVTASTDLANALQRALAHNGPALLTLPIDYRENEQLSERLGQIEVRG